MEPGGKLEPSTSEVGHLCPSALTLLRAEIKSTIYLVVCEGDGHEASQGAANSDPFIPLGKAGFPS